MVITTVYVTIRNSAIYYPSFVSVYLASSAYRWAEEAGQTETKSLIPVLYGLPKFFRKRTAQFS